MAEEITGYSQNKTHLKSHFYRSIKRFLRTYYRISVSRKLHIPYNPSPVFGLYILKKHIFTCNFFKRHIMMCCLYHWVEKI